LPTRAHIRKAHAAWGRRAHRLEPHPDTAPVVAWMFAQRLAGHSAARITDIGHRRIGRAKRVRAVLLAVRGFR
jgi:hypothetical protein